MVAKLVSDAEMCLLIGRTGVHLVRCVVRTVILLVLQVDIALADLDTALRILLLVRAVVSQAALLLVGDLR